MSDRLIGRRIIHLHTVDSTMDEVARLAAAGEPEGTVVVAEEQTAGRGRAGRSWHAPRGSAILCSILLRPPVAPGRLPVLGLAAGVAVAETLETQANVICRLKWPNDVWIAERKVAGVLVTARSGATGIDHAVVGIGINVNAPADRLVEGATSLFVCTGHRFDRSELLQSLLGRLDATYRAFVGSGGAVDLAGWRSRAALRDEVVSIAVGDDQQTGIMRGIDDDGALLLERADGVIESIHAGELTRGPRKMMADVWSRLHER